MPFNERRDIEKALLNGFPAKYVAEEFSIELADVREHMEVYESAGQGVVVPEVGGGAVDVYKKNSTKRTGYGKYDVLMDNLVRLVDRLDVLIESDKFSKDDTDQIIMTMREARQTVAALSSLDGELRNELEFNDRQLAQLRRIMLQVLTPEQKSNVLKELERVFLVDGE